MKIEIAESLAYSYLRHVKQCWLVQTNWKASAHWQRHKTDEELEDLLDDMRERFDDPERTVFKETKGAAQLLKQGELDVVGVDQRGGIHAMEVAFHEGGLNYGNRTETRSRVLKKMLRALIILHAYHSISEGFHIYFVSPKVNPNLSGPLEEIFADLQAENSTASVEWRLLINDDFVNEVMNPTLERIDTVSDTSELFARAVKLLDLSEHSKPPVARPVSRSTPTTLRDPGQQPKGTLQPLVRRLMRTLLVDCPALLSATEKRDLQDSAYCKGQLRLRLNNLPLLRTVPLGRKISGRDRYFADSYGDFYVCSMWWKEHHEANARALLDFVADIARRNAESPGMTALKEHQTALQEYIG